MKKGVLLGVLAGFAVGAAIGLLLAPEKGSRTRKNLMRKGQDLKDSIDDTIGDKIDLLLSAFRKRMEKPRRNDGNATNPSS